MARHRLNRCYCFMPNSSNSAFLWVLFSCFTLLGIFTSSLRSRNVHLTNSLVWLIALSINHPNSCSLHTRLQSLPRYVVVFDVLLSCNPILVSTAGELPFAVWISVKCSADGHLMSCTRAISCWSTKDDPRASHYGEFVCRDREFCMYTT